jgi:hypothetical protein
MVSAFGSQCLIGAKTQKLKIKRMASPLCTEERANSARRDKLKHVLPMLPKDNVVVSIG